MGQSIRKMKWVGGLKFEGTSAYGHKITTDSSEKFGGKGEGYSPTELILFGLAGCTGIDVVRILEKQRQKLTDLQIEVTSHQVDEGHPRPYYAIEIKYIARGENLDENKLAQAIELSECKYCTVSQTLKEQVEVSTSYEIAD
ncbi:MAG: OsmC family protein [candidate division Zixibacteria bacterium]|nr:OsmC family protein [candidate division Zixibacteria bacterium]